jgi:hypothetical protein
MRLILILLFAASTVFGAVEGRVINNTSGQPQADVEVSLTKLGQGGMEPAGSVKSDAQGHFRLESEAGAMYLLQAHWQGVTYSESLQPGAPTSNLELPIYDVAASVSGVAPSQHMILLETDGKQIAVSETIVYINPTKTTWNNAKTGTARIYVPAAAGDNIMARATSPGGMPLDRSVQRTAEKGVWSVDFPVKPGDTRFDFSYRLPVKEPATFESKLAVAGGSPKLIVPDGITVEGEGLASLGNESSIGASIYNIQAPSFKVKLTGTGSLKAAQSAESSDEDQGPRIRIVLPPGYERQWKWVLALTLAFLALGFFVQYLKGAPQKAAGAPKSGGKRTS